jgi:hypothetical protein
MVNFVRHTYFLYRFLPRILIIKIFIRDTRSKKLGGGGGQTEFLNKHYRRGNLPLVQYEQNAQLYVNPLAPEFSFKF